MLGRVGMKEGYGCGWRTFLTEDRVLRDVRMEMGVFGMEVVEWESVRYLPPCT